MNIRLHKNARTTPAIRREIQQATGSDYELAERFAVTRMTILQTLHAHARRQVSKGGLRGQAGCSA